MGGSWNGGNLAPSGLETGVVAVFYGGDPEMGGMAVPNGPGKGVAATCL